MYVDLFGNPISQSDGDKIKKKTNRQKPHYRAKIGSFYHPDVLNGIFTTEKFNMPIIKPNVRIPNVLNTTPFDRIKNKKSEHDSLVMFYMHDPRFYTRLEHPWDYTDTLLKYEGVLGPDLSQFIDMDYATRLYNNYWNKVFTAYWQIHGVNMYPNVTWSLPDSYEYCIEGLPKHSVIAINSMGVPKYHFSKGLWLKGYKYVVEQLQPILILRYGPKLVGEYEEISMYLQNIQLNNLRNGSKRK